MILKALLIGASDIPGDRLPGVDIDLNDLHEFLSSNRGGAWEKSEIVTLHSPTKATVNSELRKMEGADYAFISCSGHGQHQISPILSETVFLINSSETMSIAEINPRTRRQLIVVDVCRNFKYLTETKTAYDSTHAAMFESADQRRRARSKFENAIGRTSEGRIILYSCGKNQSAADPGTGGVFTQALLQAGQNLSPASSSDTVIDVKRAFEYAKTYVQTKNAPQIPEIDAGRRMDYYPFAVVGV